MGASKLAVRSESELPISVVKVNPAGITERAGIDDSFNWWTLSSELPAYRHIEDGMLGKMSGERKRPYSIPSSQRVRLDIRQTPKF